MSKPALEGHRIYLDRLVERSTPESPRVVALGRKDRKVQRTNGIRKRAARFSGAAGRVDLLGEIAPSARASAGRGLRLCPLRIAASVGHQFWSSVPARLGAKDFEPVRLIQCESSAIVW